MMKILQEATTPEGDFKIRLEDWSEDYACYKFGSTLAVYPKKYIRCRAYIEFQDHETASAVFEALKIGSTHVLDVDFVRMESGGKHIPLKNRLEERMKKHGAL
jgi:hypothetical protein